MFRFQPARNMLPRRPEEAITVLESAITRTEQALAESRDAIKDLRGEALQHDLAESLAQVGQEFASSQPDHDAPLFSLTVEGQSRRLSSMIQDEVYRIAREILANAFRHAHARRIETEIRYDRHSLRLRFRDDGIGIDPAILNAGGRPGHWGLPGIRERAQKISASLDFWSDAGAGTEVQFTIPAAIAYATTRARARFRPIRRWKNGARRT
jgi:signal transduction histidine kinase